MMILLKNYANNLSKLVFFHIFCSHARCGKYRVRQTSKKNSSKGFVFLLVRAVLASGMASAARYRATYTVCVHGVRTRCTNIEYYTHERTWCADIQQALCTCTLKRSRFDVERVHEISYTSTNSSVFVGRLIRSSSNEK